MNKAASAIVVLFALLVALPFYIQPVKASPQVNILSDSGFSSLPGEYQIVGEVKNVGDSTAWYVKINATYYDANNAVITTKLAYAELTALPPNRRTPFRIFLYDESLTATNVDHYALSVAYIELNRETQIGLRLLSHNSSGDSENLNVMGEIENAGTTTSTNTIVVATFYDSAGKVVAADFASSVPQDIPSGQKAVFEVEVIESSRVPLVNSYVLSAESVGTDAIIVESEQYAIIPEFPSIIILPVLLGLTFFAAVIMKRKH
jgi:hypothetical protein